MDNPLFFNLAFSDFIRYNELRKNIHVDEGERKGYEEEKVWAKDCRGFGCSIIIVTDSNYCLRVTGAGSDAGVGGSGGNGTGNGTGC